VSGKEIGLAEEVGVHEMVTRCSGKAGDVIELNPEVRKVPQGTVNVASIWGPMMVTLRRSPRGARQSVIRQVIQQGG
jgi:hypothetical protein